MEQFAYCAHNWWLAKQGVDPITPESAQGNRDHDTHEVEAKKAEGTRKQANSALNWSFQVMALAASLTFLALEAMFLRATEYHVIFLTTAIVATGASGALLTIALDNERRTRQRQKEAGLVPGKLVQSEGDHKVLEDPEWNLRGTPDQVLKTAHGLVPVELKTGKSPSKPFPNHQLQLACYLRLLEVQKGRRPEYGLLNYRDGVFRVEWTPELEAELRTTLDRMEQAVREGKADRDHGHVGRCRGCARREACDQRLV